MKLLTLTSAILMSGSVLAHNSCDIDLNAHVRIDNKVVEFSDENQPLYKIVDDKYLYVEGDKVSLDKQQQVLVTQYSKDIKALVPEVRGVVTEGIDLAVEGVGLAFNELLGEDNDVGNELTSELTIIKEELAQKLSLEHGVSIGKEGVADDNFFGKEFENRIETVVESAVKKSMGTLLIAVGKEMLFSGGDPEAFEARMENFGEQIETEMESRAEELEKKANVLCYSVKKLDEQEEHLREEVSELAPFNMIKVDSRHSDKI